MVNSPLIRPYFLGGWHWGVPLGSRSMMFHGLPTNFEYTPVPQMKFMLFCATFCRILYDFCVLGTSWCEFLYMLYVI